MRRGIPAAEGMAIGRPREIAEIVAANEAEPVISARMATTAEAGVRGRRRIRSMRRGPDARVSPVRREWMTWREKSPLG
jgi:hypothetical protein